MSKFSMLIDRLSDPRTAGLFVIIAFMLGACSMTCSNSMGTVAPVINTLPCNSQDQQNLKLSSFAFFLTAVFVLLFSMKKKM